MTMFTNSNARRRSVIWILLMIAVASLSAAGSSSAFAMGTGGGSTTNPWIQSDQADYAPGSTVTLNGGNWAPGENVHVFVDDANGHTWNHSADVTADDSGLIEDVFNLPNAFVSDYSVTATGDVSGTAATTFTDSQPQNVAVGAPTSVTVVPGASAVYGTVSVTMNGNANNCTMTLGLDAALPAGATAVFGSSPVTTNANYASTFRIDTTAATPLGTSTFHVTVTPSANCQGSQTPTTGPLVTLIVVPKTVGTVTVSSQTGALTSGTAGSATYTVTVNRNGAAGTAFSADLSEATALPSGATASFNPATVAFAAADTSKTSTLTISTTAATPAGSGSFTVKAENTAVVGNSNTGNGTLTVNAPCTAPVLTTQPAAQSITYGANASFSAAASGAPAPTEQWQVNAGSGFTNLTGETGATLTLTKPGVASGGNLYRAVFTNGCGSVNSNSVALTVAKKNLTISGAVAQGKVYDRTTGTIVSFTGASLVGVVSPDVVAIDSSAYSANFATAAAGTAKPVTVTGIALSGAASGNYSVSQPTGLTASISQRMVTASITASDKTYDGTRTAAIASCALEAGTGTHGVLSPDVVGCSASNGQFGTAQAGSGKGVTADVALTGSDQANYQLTGASALTTATINQRNVTASISGSDKTYDGTRSETITSCSLEAALGNHGVVSGDAVGCSASNGQFGTAQAGSDKAVTADVALTGAGQANYQLTSPSAATTATINQRNVTASISAAGKVYDGNRNAAITSCTLEAATGNHGVVSGDAVGCDASNGRFATRNAGNQAVSADVALNGAGDGNYQLTSPSAATTATINQRNVTASISASDKTYDGTRDATITGCTLEDAASNHGVVSGDTIGCDASNGKFATKDAGSLAVTADVALNGGDNGNYQLTSSSASTPATIAQRNVTASISALDKTYDGTRDATIPSCTVEAQSGDHGVVSPDVVGCDASNGKFATKDAGSQSVSADVALNGGDDGNYHLTSSTSSTSATINQRNVTASISASDKTYDGNRDATITSCSLEAALGNHGVVSGDAVGCDASNGKFATKDAGSQAVAADVALNGGDDGNYQLTSASAATRATINQRNVSASISASDKTYDGNRDATITSCSLEAATGDHGVVSPDVVGCSASNGQFGTAQAGSGKDVTADVALSGADKANYQLTSSSSSTTATINQRNVTASITADGKTYDGNRNAMITGCTLEDATGNHGAVSGDTVGCDATNGKFATKDAGSQAVTAVVTLNGGDDGNYQLTSSTASTTATIDPRNVTSSITASDKPYDGTRDATITGCTLEAATGNHGVVSGDTVACDATNGKFATKDAGTQAVTADVALSGSDQGDYQLTVGSASTTAAISMRFVTATITASDKPYDSNRDATVTSCVLDGQSGDTGVVTSETVGCDASSGNFATKDAGLQLVTADVALNGADDGNYQLTSSTSSTTATINQRNVTASITASDKTYDSTRDAAVSSCTLEVQSGDHGVISPDVVGCVASNGKFATTDTGSQAVTADVALNGGDNANYQLTSPSAATTATIAQRNVTASISASDKTYDGTRDAVISSCTLEAATGNHGVVSGDTVACDASNGKFAAKDAGSQAVTADVALNGGDDGNYQLTSPSAATTAMINQRNVTASITAADKTYDGSRDAVISSCTLEAATGNHGVVSGDAVGCSASNGKFATRNAGSQVVSADVALSGSDDGNYQLTSASAATTATINQRNVTASISAMDKTYDSTRNATITGCTLETAAGNHGVVSGDTVGCDASNGKFATRNAGNQAVSADVALNGSDDGNYQLTSAPSSTTATIKQAPLNISAVTDSRQYNGGVSSSGIPLVTTSDLQGPDTVSGLGQQFQSKNVLGAGGSTLVVSAYTVNDGNSGNNYNVTLHNASGTITAASLNIWAVTDSRQYNGTTSSSGTPTLGAGDLQTGDTVTGLGQNFQSKNVLGANLSTLVPSSGYTIHDGNSGNNYTVIPHAANGTITAAPLNIWAVTDSRQYNGTTSSSGTPTLGAGDLQTGDSVTGRAQQFQFKNVLGAGGSTLVVSAYTVNDGNSGHNYVVTTHSASGTITAKPLTVTGITAASKPWDGNTSATLNTSGAALNGVVSGDSVGLDTSAAVGTYSSSAVGTWTVQVSGLALTGADKTNYSLVQPTTTASIGAWSATGFYDPVGSSSSLFVAAPGAAPTAGANTVWNTVKGGQTVPLKFNLYTSQGSAERRSTSDISGFDAVKLATCAGDSTDAIDFVTTGNTSLRYDTTGMQFIQNWKTPATPATCYRVDVKFLDGSAIYAFFKMTK